MPGNNGSITTTINGNNALPASRITAISNSRTQRELIEAAARARGLTNLAVVTADVRTLELPRASFDRVVSIEMFEHMRNYELLLRRVASWLRPGGALFVHVFAHHRYAYPFEDGGASDWMAREFFTGGIMPSADLFRSFRDDLQIVDEWRLSGMHYARTAEAWYANLVAHRGETLGAARRPPEVPALARVLPRVRGAVRLRGRQRVAGRSLPDGGDVIDSQVHHAVIDGIAARGHAPTVDEIAAVVGAPSSSVEQALRRLAMGHGLVLHPNSLELWVAHPFSLSPTANWVAAGSDRGWWAPCLWCAFGIVEIAGGDTIHTRIAGEAEAISIAVRDPGDLLVHWAVSPRDAWQNVHHHCATLLPFRSAEDIDAWSARHRLPRGEAVPIATARDLAARWYGKHRQRDWRKWSVEEAGQIFASCGLTSAFWALPRGNQTF